MQQHDEILEVLKDIKEILSLNQPVLSLSQFCRFASISKDYAYKLTSNGKLKFYRPFGKKIYIDREDAIELLKQNPVNATNDLAKVVIGNFLKNKF